jgi:membrane fusion protein (multidrug efflux system)
MSASQESMQSERTFSPRRRRALTIAAAVFIVLGIVAALYWFIELRHFQSTDDAYVGGNVVQVTPQVPGIVTSIAADDNDYVEAGHPLITLDGSDTQLMLDQAKADLARVVREVRTLFSNSGAIRAEVTARESDVNKARDDLKRRVDLTGQGAVSAEEIQHAKTTLSSAEAALVAAREKLSGNLAQTEGTTIENHPLVLTAAAKVREAFIASRRTFIPAPVSGTVAKRNVQIGQRVQPGAPLMAIVPLGDLWVDANFKENQLGDMRLDQPVTLRSDLYGKSVVYHGRISGVGAGTGGAFALLPAQNASGNWIKIVQRVPVRILLSKDEVGKNPLRIGLSMRVDVDVADQSGLRLSQAPRESLAYSTRVYESDTSAADAIVAQIISDNSGTARAGLDVPAESVNRTSRLNTAPHRDRRGA